MSSYKFFSLQLLFCVLLLLIVLIVRGKTQAVLTTKKCSNNSSISSLYIFGDSTADSGNNNFLVTDAKANFPPYGRDFVNHKPTGRFSNGRLVGDFISLYLGFKKYPHPYMDPMLSMDDMEMGICFASAGSGYDPLTPLLSNSISIPEQLRYFKQYKAKLEQLIGKNKTEDHVKKALFLVSAGADDFIFTYFGFAAPIIQKSFTLPDYEQFLLKNLHNFIQGLWDEGARRMGVYGLPPIGCLPIIITLFSDNKFQDHRKCNDFFNSISKNYNTLLENELKAMQSSLAKFGAKIAYINSYEPLLEIIQGGSYSFAEVNKGCCGTGLIETTFFCNQLSLVCHNASNYVFFDSFHPTERAYQIIFDQTCSTINSIILE